MTACFDRSAKWFQDAWAGYNGYLNRKERMMRVENAIILKVMINSETKKADHDLYIPL
jgi:hypothetical protein